LATDDHHDCPGCGAGLTADGRAYLCDWGLPVVGAAWIDTVCLLMPNRPEFLAIWIGVTRAGGVVALLNTNLMGTALAHCINVVAPKHIIVDADMLPALQSAEPLLTSNAKTPGAKTWLHGNAVANLPRIDREIQDLSGKPLADGERRALTIEDRALFIYTSKYFWLWVSDVIGLRKVWMSATGMRAKCQRLTRPMLLRMWCEDMGPTFIKFGQIVASSAGMFNNYAIVQSVDKIIPVDIYLPGCPPRPEALLDAVIKLQRKIRGEPLVKRPA